MLDENDDFRRPCTIGVQCPQSRPERDVLAVTSGQVGAVLADDGVIRWRAGDHRAEVHARLIQRCRAG